MFVYFWLLRLGLLVLVFAFVFNFVGLRYFACLGWFGSYFLGDYRFGFASFMGFWFGYFGAWGCFLLVSG